MKIWQRYFLKELFKVFIFFLFAFFFLYAILDYSMHMDDFFKDKHLQIGQLLHYYLQHFLKRADFLLPLAALIASVKVLTHFNTSRQWMALQVAGLRTGSLMKPFFYLALLCALFNFANFQYFLPRALSTIESFDAEHFKHSHRAKQKELIQILHLRDNSKLLYQSYDAEKDALFDVLWVRSPQEIWRMKYLNANPGDPKAQYVDHLIVGREGFLEKTESFDTYAFPDLKWHPRMKNRVFIPFENYSLKQLYTLLKSEKTTPFEIPKIQSHLYFKIAIPLLSFLVILAVAPYCIVFSRHQNPFYIYALGLFGLFAVYTILDTSVILGEHAVLSPLIALFGPLLFLGTLFTYQYVRKT
ncbi:MAG: LptF/LptG family permease [Verrucomicrobia bacterium]|nr:LptF/LptG family permease [Verrucomicrobiota bacterium]